MTNDRIKLFKQLDSSDVTPAKRLDTHGRKWDFVFSKIKRPGVIYGNTPDLRFKYVTP